MRPPRRRGMLSLDATGGPRTGKHVDIGRGERPIVRRGLELVGNREAVARAKALVNAPVPVPNSAHTPPDSRTASAISSSASRWSMATT